MSPPSASTRAQIAAALLTVYIVWGSTYLAIRYVVEVLPPLSTAGIRFLIAGTALYAWMRWRGEPAPSRVHWKHAAASGGLLILGGNGGVVLAERYVPSGLTALLVSTVPLWMAILESWRRKTRPPAAGMLGLGLGLLGVGILVSPSLSGAHAVHPWGAVVLLLASMSWACGSLYARHSALPSSALLATSMQMICGGALQSLAGIARGELPALLSAQWTPAATIGFWYLILFGSLLGFTAYAWLLRHASVASVSTYAYVNPVVAVLLGRLVAHEPLDARIVLAAATILSGVMLILTRRRRPQ
jgi:drug/metabolite transporter (DMT)-like permease